jgi:uncharacterized SAM-binding protein YcdF (DUF218 family)
MWPVGTLTCTGSLLLAIDVTMSTRGSHVNSMRLLRPEPSSTPAAMAALLHVAGVLALLAAAGFHSRLSGRRRRLAWLAGPALILLSLIVTGDSFVIGKWLPRLLMPAGALWLILSALACWQLSRDERVGRWLAAVSLLFWASHNNVIATSCVGMLEAGYAWPDEGVKLDAMLVLGGGTSEAPHGVQVSSSGDRIVTAARLYHRGVAPRIVVGGRAVGALSSSGRKRELGADARRLLVELGVPDEAVVVHHGGRNTREEVAALSDLVSERGWKRVGLLTSAWHLPRAMRNAERAGLDAIPVPADFRGQPTAWNVVEILPSAAGGYNMRLAAWEAVGIALGR